MIIKRDGLEFRLTPAELWNAYLEEEHILTIADIDLQVDWMRESEEISEQQYMYMKHKGNEEAYRVYDDNADCDKSYNENIRWAVTTAIRRAEEEGRLEKSKYLKVGSIVNNDGVTTIHREFYRQGNVFKDEEAYLYKKDKPCYVPELSDQVYTANDFLELCNGQQEFADMLFEDVDWQHPETELSDIMANREWVVCEGCGKLVNYGEGYRDKRCPYCGKEVA